MSEEEKQEQQEQAPAEEPPAPEQAGVPKGSLRTMLIAALPYLTAALDRFVTAYGLAGDRKAQNERLQVNVEPVTLFAVTERREITVPAVLADLFADETGAELAWAKDLVAGLDRISRSRKRHKPDLDDTNDKK